MLPLLAGLIPLPKFEAPKEIMLRRLFIFLLPIFFICTRQRLSAQFSDDFSDGNLSANPTWIGMTDSFTVSSGQLRSIVSNFTNPVNLNLFSPTNQEFNSWDFFFRLAFNPSSQNYAEFWLMADNSNLNLAENGYFVRIGGNTGDGIGLFKLEGGSESVLISPDGNTLVNGTSNNLGFIRVSRSETGLWTISEKITGTSFVPFGTASDNSITASLGLGIRIQTTKTNRGKHYFDDILASGPAGPDTLPPILQSLSLAPPQSIILRFSEPVDSIYAADIERYAFIPAQAISSAERDFFEPEKVRITLTDTLLTGSSIIQVVSSRDTAGNVQNNIQSLSFSYNPPQPAPWRSVQINEIYADEIPSLGLPEGEFMELYNRGTTAVNLQGWQISDAGSPVILPEYLLNPGSFLILCSNSDTAAFKEFGAVLGISLPSLNNTGDSLKLKDPFGNLVDEVNYSSSWYRDPSKAGGGYSLEQINPMLRCSGKDNWIASSEGIGGTPGSANSVLSIQPDLIPPVLDSLIAETATSIRLVFSEAISPAGINSSVFSLNPNPGIAGILFIDGRRLRITFLNNLQTGQSYSISCSSIRDCEGNNAGNITRNFIFQPPQPLAYRQLQINEIYADETPPTGVQPLLPLKEYLELHNHGSTAVQLRGVRVRVGSTQVILPEYVLPSGGYLTLCDEDSLSLFQALGPALGINLPSLLNTGAEIRLLDFQDKEIDKVVYSTDWHDDASKKEGGYSLEQVNPGLICSSRANWRSSVAGIGGTPGQENSVLSDVPDADAPALLKASKTGNSGVVLQFSEPLNEAVIIAADIQVTGGNSVSQILYRFPDQESVTLQFSSPFETGKLYTLQLSNIRDCAGNRAATFQIPLGTGRSPRRFELLITEVQADDSPENILPKAEYVEIFNNSASLLELGGLKFSDGSSTATLPDRLLPPGAYLILCGTSSTVLFSEIAGIQVQAVASFPSLNQEGDKLSLSLPDGKQIHRFHFQSSQFSPYSLWEKGWSLEMIDLQFPCGEFSNWAISTAATGGTPGKENSVKTQKPDLQAPALKRITIPDSSHIRLYWDEQMDSTSLETLSLSFSRGFSEIGRSIIPGDYSSLIVEINPPLPPRTVVAVSADGAADCAGNTAGKQTLEVARPDKPLPGDWILSEILFDPLSGGTDYVELQNVSTGYRDLKEIRVANSEETKGLTEESQLLPPGGFALITKSTALTLRDYPKGRTANFVEAELPVFNLDSGTVRIIGPDNSELEKFIYSADHHAPILDEVKGVSLERVSPKLPSNRSDSWQSASADAGYGTPGFENSNNRDFDLSGTFKADPEVFTPNGDGNRDFLLISYELAESGYFANLRIYSSTGVLVKELALSSAMGASGFWKWDGRNTEGKLADQGMYLAVFELNKQGERSRIVRVPLAITDDR